ncbi:helix-turn-helix domain-containing protein [Peptoniphilus sp.]|uniref:helix-turn-helix domain-containing protein n=1 Tax=Peptoniphilus sp. TaxID=1971214 RepID=UPI003459EC03
MSYNHLTIEERSCIYQFLNLGMSIRKIAEALRRSPSTISREYKEILQKLKVQEENIQSIFQ